jgi:hypothetical protein
MMGGDKKGQYLKFDILVYVSIFCVCLGLLDLNMRERCTM